MSDIETATEADQRFQHETGMTREEAIVFIGDLKKTVNLFYGSLFSLGTGGKFHAFVEWCGVMGEHLNIVEGLVKNGHNPFADNVHSGHTLPIPSYQLAYMAEKMECIFNGAITVTANTGEADGES
jgi:hypothetical protein